MKVSYYPGCTLKTKAKNMDTTLVGSLKALGVDVEELPRWNCCGAVLSLSDDDLLHLIAPVRNLIRAMEQGSEILITACSMCYNTLARANLIVRNDKEKLDTLNSFMEEEPNYEGDMEVMHLLNFLEQEVGWDKVKEQVKKPLEGLKVAPYYGCTLMRPKEIAIDPRNYARIFQEFLEALGATVVDFPAAHDCCGSYQMVSNPEIAMENCSKILQSAGKWSADIIASSCPLCEFNLGRMQAAIIDKHPEIKTIPTIYFTQLLAIALGLPKEDCHLELNMSATCELLEPRNFLSA
jgi:heterodisulfide reductase subunit B